MFDPEKVERFGDEDEMEHPIRCVNELDYDALLALYRESDRLLNLERGLKLLKSGMPDTGDPTFNEVLETYPIAEMIQRGWLEGVTGFDNLPLLAKAICKFFQVGSIPEVPQAKF